MAPHAITVGSVGLEPHLMDQPIPGPDAGSAKHASHRRCGDVVFCVIGPAAGADAPRRPVRALDQVRGDAADLRRCERTSARLLIPTLSG